MDDARLGTNARLTVDLDRQVVLRPGGEAIPFTVDPHGRAMLLEGLDEIGQTMTRVAAIDSYEIKRRAAEPWMPAIAV